MPLFEFNGRSPSIDPSAYVAPTGVVCGEVSLGPRASVWFGAVVRGDITPITIGEASNVQDNSVIHVTYKGQGTHLGRYVSLGHGVILHDCTIHDYSLIGMGVVVLDKAQVGPWALVGAGSVVTPRTVIPEGMLALGSPAKPVRPLNEAERKLIMATANRYQQVMESYRTGAPFLGDEPK